VTVGLSLNIPGGWMERAACGDRCDDLFFPVGTSGSFAQDQIKAAKAICTKCPVLTECRQWALAAGTDAEYGIWGGLDELERRRLRGVRLPRHGTRTRQEIYGCDCELCEATYQQKLKRERERKQEERERGVAS
jgi:WhiB family transcriptional regulator, redox-sensing transcriptional regulator